MALIAYQRYCTPSGWNAIAGNSVQRPRLASDISADYLVVGAGYAGLAAARRLAQLFPDARIVVVDGGQAAESSSGRNSGFMIDLPYAKIQASSSETLGNWQTALMKMGKTILKGIVDHHGIACGWADTGHYKAATTASGALQLQALCDTLEANHVPYRRLTSGGVKRELGTQHYSAVIWLPSCTLVQPAALVNGLVAALPHNVDVYFDSPVTHIGQGGSITVRAGNGTITAGRVLLCANTGMPAMGYGRYRQLTMYTYAGLTRPLNDAESAAVGEAADWGVTPVERLEATTRKIDGNRYMLRAGFSYDKELHPDAVRDLLIEKLRARHPSLPDDVFAHTWGGAVSLTRNGAPMMKRVADGIYAVSGCNASGILKMTALGHLLVDFMAGKPSALLEQTATFSRPTFMPPDPLRRIAVNINLRKFQKELDEDKRKTA